MMSTAADAREALVVIPYLDTGYRYKVVRHGQEAGFEEPSFDDSEYSIGEGGFGSSGGFCELNRNAVRTDWLPTTDILLRKEFPLAPGAHDLQIRVAIDDEVQVFINGSDISGGLRSGKGCAVRDSLVFKAPDGLLLAGMNLLAVRGRDNGWASYLDVQVSHTFCGNGTLGSGEQCDDSNRLDEDGCSSECLREYCGDNVLQTGLGEQCDDGNTEDGDGCSTVCKSETPAGPTVVGLGLVLLAGFLLAAGFWIMRRKLRKQRAARTGEENP